MSRGAIGIDGADLHNRCAGRFVLEHAALLYFPEDGYVVVDVEHLDVYHRLSSELILVLYAHDQRVLGVALVVQRFGQLYMGDVLLGFQSAIWMYILA